MTDINKEYTEKLIENALDFLDKAINQIENSPKHSLVSFCTGIELFLKARLVYEHWSLIDASNPPNFRKFQCGDFKSVNFRDIITRIKSVTGENIPAEIKKIFSTLANHRNRIIHFYHEVDDKEQEREKIAIEQLNGWYFLQKLFEKWDFLICGEEQNNKIDSIGHKMSNYKKYQKTIYKRLKPEIDANIKRGAVYRACTTCNQEASQEEGLTNHLYKYKCRVCSFCENILKTQCESCKEKIEIDADSIWDEIKCSKCNSEFQKTSFFKQLDEISQEPASTRPKNQMRSAPHPSCSNCADSCESVILHSKYYICQGCLFVDTEIQPCDWCDVEQIGGVPKDSMAFGCAFCDGGVTHYASKDD